MDKSKEQKEFKKEKDIKNYEEKPEKQKSEEDIEPDTTDNPGVTHIPPDCINE